jgi:hypothetical protein
MDDFTKTKLINNLIDLVDYFYENKRKSGSASQIKYLKGFCEGIAHTLVELSVITQDEAKKILKGIGKRREILTTPPPNTKKTVIPKTEKEEQTADVVPESLDIPTIFRKQMENR